NVPANDFTSLIAWLKANPDKASQGTAGPGSAAHVAGVFFQNITGTRFQFVPYRGAAPIMQDLLARQIDLTVDQAGLPGFYISVWHGLWVPKGTPKDVVAKLNAAVVEALADPAVRQRLA